MLRASDLLKAFAHLLREVPAAFPRFFSLLLRRIRDCWRRRTGPDQALHCLPIPAGVWLQPGVGRRDDPVLARQLRRGIPGSPAGGSDDPRLSLMCVIAQTVSPMECSVCNAALRASATDGRGVRAELFSHTKFGKVKGRIINACGPVVDALELECCYRRAG